VRKLTEEVYPRSILFFQSSDGLWWTRSVNSSFGKLSSSHLHGSRFLGWCYSQLYSYIQWHPVRQARDLDLPECRKWVCAPFLVTFTYFKWYKVWRTSTPEPTRGAFLLPRGNCRVDPIIFARGWYYLDIYQGRHSLYPPICWAGDIHYASTSNSPVWDF